MRDVLPPRPSSPPRGGKRRKNVFPTGFHLRYHLGLTLGLTWGTTLGLPPTQPWYRPPSSGYSPRRRGVLWHRVRRTLTTRRRSAHRNNAAFNRRASNPEVPLTPRCRRHRGSCTTYPRRAADSAFPQSSGSSRPGGVSPTESRGSELPKAASYRERGIRGCEAPEDPERWRGRRNRRVEASAAKLRELRRDYGGDRVPPRPSRRSAGPWGTILPPLHAP
jgi:hypothetical protein